VIYHLYGVRLRSAWALPYSSAVRPFVAEITLSRQDATCFADARRRASRPAATPAGRRLALLDDGRAYLQWPGLFEFLIAADGREIAGRELRRGFIEGFHSYLLGQALSYALIRQGLEPLHATVVTVDGGAVAFLGDSGHGKSSLAAAFVESGYPLLTDDLLVLTGSTAGWTAHPGPPRLKLFPQSARLLVPGRRGTRMMRSTPKLLYPLGPAQVAGEASRVRAMYVIAPPSRPAARVAIRRLGARQACVALLRNTFNASTRDREQAARHFALSAHLATTVPVKSLAYPRSYDALPQVRDAVLADLAGDSAAWRSDGRMTEVTGSLPGKREQCELSGASFVEQELSGAFDPGVRAELAVRGADAEAQLRR
jgi:hypothetical protein